MTPNGPSTIDVAAAQIASECGDVAANVRKHIDVIDAARGAGADVLVFPELSITGHGSGADTLGLALRRDDAPIVEIARAAGCDGYITKPIDTRTFVGLVRDYAGAGSGGPQSGSEASAMLFKHTSSL